MILHTAKSKHFAERLNKCLDELGLPTDPRSRLASLSKMLNISRQQTRMIIEGYLPDEQVMHLLEQELEVDPNWLLKK